jgi:hypothetical protein
MKIRIILILLVASLAACVNIETNSPGVSGKAVPVIDSLELTNDFYDNTPVYSLPVSDLTVNGEVETETTVKLSELPLRSVICKEAVTDTSGAVTFVGAYRYDGYSLFDILKNIKIKKINSEEFNPIIDLYVEVYGKTGEKAVFSWGEIFYPDNLHSVIVASGVSRIVPSKSKDFWPLPDDSKIVASCDLVTERNISHPVKITVRSFPKSFVTVKGMRPMYSDKFTLTVPGAPEILMKDIDFSNTVTYNTVFYGRGMGIHSTSPFSGIFLKDVLAKHIPAGKDVLREGIMCVAARDGYRIAVSYSELFNRNDQQEFMMVKTEKDSDGGLYRVFPASDFFSDRAVKSVTHIILNY